jgi:sporulation protein YqfC
VNILKDKKTEINKQSRFLKSAFLRFLELPEYAVGASRIEIISNNEAVVESCRGILEYNNECIRLITPGMTVKFNGRDLKIGCMTGTAAVVTGTINSNDLSALR